MKLLFVLLLVAICLARSRPGFTSRFLTEKNAKKDVAPMGCNLSPSERGYIKCYPSADPTFEIACNQTSGACNRIYVNGAVPEVLPTSDSKKSVRSALDVRSYQLEEKGESMNLLQNGGFEYGGYSPYETFEHWFSGVVGGAKWEADKGHTHIGHGIKTPRPASGDRQAAVVHQDGIWFGFLAQAFKLNSNGDCNVELDLSFKLDLQNFGATWSFSDVYLDADIVFEGPYAGQFFSVSIGNGDAGFAQTVYATQFGQKNLPAGYHNYRFRLDNAAFLHEHVHDNWFYIEFDISSTTGRILVAIDDVYLSARCVGGEHPHQNEHSGPPNPPHGGNPPHGDDEDDNRK